MARVIVAGAATPASARRRVTLLAAAVSATCIAGQPLPGYTTQCGWSYTAPGASVPTSTWDLTPMQSTQGSPYVVTDLRVPTTTYYFGVCADTVQPSPTVNPTVCQGTGGGQPATGWQFENPSTGGSSCYRLGVNASAGWNFSVYDPLYPARGVMLTYPLGDRSWCPGGRPRTLTLELLCSPSAVATGPSAYTSGAYVSEENWCDYHVQLPSAFACPQQCLTAGPPAPVVCNGNGVCGYNSDTKTSGCFCNSGFSGATCGNRDSPASGMSAEGIILIIVCIVLAGVLGLLGYMLVKLRRLQVDPAAYGQLTNKFNELGQLA